MDKLTVTTEMMSTRNRLLVKVCDLVGVCGDDVMSASRTADVSLARHIMMWALCMLWNYRPTQIGILMRRSHATASYAIRRANTGWLGKRFEPFKARITELFENGLL